jgi:hypothetical protein
LRQREQGGVSVADRISALGPEQRALLELLRRKKAKAAGQRVHLPPPVPRRSGPTGEGDWPLAFDQEWLWSLHQASPGATAYNVDVPSRLRGPLHLPAIAAALNEIVRRHAAWRTTFPAVDGRPVQRVAAHRTQDLVLIDLSALPPERREREAQLALVQVTQAAFDFARGPLVRSALVRLAEQEHVCLITVHHLVTDWIAFQILWTELAVLYEAYLDGRPSPLPELPVHYVDYAVWQREWLQGEALEELAGYWRRKVADFPLVLELPADRPRPPVRRMRGGRYVVNSGPEPADALRSFAQREGATMFMAVFAAIFALLHRFTGRDRMILGSNNANRNRPELEPIIGYFLIPVPFAVDLSGDPSFRELLARVRKVALEAYVYQDIPFGKLLEAIGPEPVPGLPPIIQSLVLVLDGQYNQSRLPGIASEVFNLYDAGARYDLMFGLYDYPAGIIGPLEYDAALFDFSTVARLVELFYRLLDAVTADPELRLSQLPACGDAAWRQVAAGPGGADVPREELERRAEGQATSLRRLGVGPGSKVGLLLAPSPELVAAALAVARAGGVAVPLDPGQPVYRLNPLLADPDLVLLVHRGPLPDGLEPVTPCRDLAGLEEAA